MTKHFLEAIPDDQGLHSEENRYLGQLFSKQNLRTELIDSCIDIFGPLGTRERWELLENAHFPKVLRSKLILSGSAYETAISVVNGAIDWKYPANVLLLQLIDLTTLPSLDAQEQGRVSTAMSRLLIQEETVQQVMRRHENTR